MAIINGAGSKWPSKYVGCVTDIKWIQAVWKLPYEERRKHYNYTLSEMQFHGGLDFIYGLNRKPRVYGDEL